MAGASFQTQVNVQYAAGIPGELYDDSPERSTTWELSSSSQNYNIIGATAFTATSADPGSGDACGVAAAGGTGQFVGILSNSKLYANVGTSAGALYPSFIVQNGVPAQLVTMGHLWVTLPGSPNVGDLISYDQTTGALSSYPKTTSFTATLNATTGVLNVTAITAGAIVPGMVIATGAGAVGTVITGYDSGLGGTGTYYTDYAGNGGGNVSSTAMTANSLPAPATSFTATLATTGILTVSGVGSGYIVPGQVISGTGVPANSIVEAYGTGSTSGEGGTGTYQLTQAPATAISVGETMTADQQVAIPRAEVILFQPAGNGGIGVISLTNA